MFLFKKIVAQFFLPMPICLFVCFTGLVLLWWTKRQSAGKILVTLGLLLLTAFSSEPVANGLLSPLERRYPAYQTRARETPKFVVVLGGGHTSDPRLPVTSQISDESLKRLVEGIRIYRDNPGSKLVLSGGSWPDPVPDAEIMAGTARALGISDADVIVEAASRDTEDQARLLKPIVGTNAFLLVTSANHMLRSMRLFESEGTKPLAASAEHLVKRSVGEPGAFFPRGLYLRRSEAAFHERIGLGWLVLRRKI
ncbi:MAG: envelope biogenesis factor ElyC [Verrucomicrobiota bacterium]